MNRGGSRIFVRMGCTRLLLYFNTNKPHSFFFCRIPVVFENRRSSQGGRGGAHPLHPPPRSALDEDEFHFLLNCPKYSIPKEKFYNQIQHNFVNFNQLSCTELIIKLMNSQNFSLKFTFGIIYLII